MGSYSEEPIYNLKVVMRETGIKADTLRAWERRYGLPIPARSPGRHRLYSQWDVEIIKWLIARQSEGMIISRAVQLWRNLEGEGKDPLQEFAASATESPELRSGTALTEIRQDWVSACLNFDENRAEHLLAQAFALYPQITVCLEVLQKGLAQIGEAWYQGRSSVQQEHFASALALRRINTLISASPPPMRSGTILVGCPPEEEHTFPGLLLVLMLRQRGWKVVYLGANVPLARFESTIKLVLADIIILTAQQLHTAASLLEVANNLSVSIPLAYGGLIFNRQPTLRKRIPGYFLGEDIKDAALRVEQVLSQHLPPPTVPPPIENYTLALGHFREKRLAIESDLGGLLAPTDIAYDHLTKANTQMAKDIIAALTLGEIEYLGVELNWIDGLMANFEIPAQTLKDYLGAYRQSAAMNLDQRGRPILDWLAEVIQMKNL